MKRVLIVCLLAACGGGSSKTQSPDGSVPDGSVPDASAPDAAAPDASPASTSFVDMAEDEGGCAVRSDGTMWCWGANWSGQVGDGTTTEQDVPVQVGTDTDWARVWYFNSAVLARKQDGSLWGWGSNSAGLLGAGNADQHTPIQIGTDKDWGELAVGGGFACGLKTDQSLWCWGDDSMGELGDGGNTEVTAPQQVGTAKDWIAVAASPTHACAIEAPGKLYCWGDDSTGQLGDGGSTMVPTPQQVGTDTDWKAVAAGDDGNVGYTCAVKTGGTLWCWGGNDVGQLGNKTEAGANVAPAQVGTDTDWTDVRVSYRFTAARKTDGSWRFWGENEDDQIGNGSLLDALVPTAPTVPADFTKVSGGWDTVCGLDAAGAISCWGSDWYGGRGDGKRDDDYDTKNTTLDQHVQEASWKTMSAGPTFSCATDSTGELFCWGDSRNGVLGTPTVNNYPAENPLVTGVMPSDFDAGDNGACAIVSGQLWCWGTVTGTEADSPTQVGTDSDWAHVSIASSYLAIKTGGTLWQDGAQVGTDKDWASASAGEGFVCAIKTGGALWCWGPNDVTSSGSATPTQVGTDTTWASVSAGRGKVACGVKTDHTLWCWGVGFVGDGATDEQDAPVQIGTDTDWASAIVSDTMAYALKIDGSLYAWGNNSSGQLATGDNDPRLAPALVASPMPWISVESGDGFFCGTHPDGTVWCAGQDNYLQFGINYHPDRSTPLFP